MTTRTRSVFFLLAAVTVGALAQAVFAQAPAAAAAAAAPAAAAAKDQSVTLWGMWVTGGWAMYPIGALSIAGAALTIFGFIFLREPKMVQSSLVPVLQNLITNLDFRNASATCSGTPGVFSNILNAGLLRLSDGITDVATIEKAMEEAAVEENTNGLRPISYLSIIASVAPMFGLLGTVSGMIKAFQKIGLGAMGDPEKLANDIGEAMITTAFGLIVGIPFMFFYFYLKSRFQGNMARIGRLAGNLTHHLSAIMDRLRAGELPLDQVTLPDLTAPMPQPAAAPAAPAQPQS
ncbi:MAG: MotA/TolQ/ExbB proton channel family protein [Lentisphaerae bacterium]|nr:MotA/TolQ/ExbB proton channel family protein [Lentisphaerota bacterium]